MRFESTPRLLAALILSLSAAQVALAATPADRVLPIETVGFISFTNVPDVSDRWSSTQVGRLAADPTMRPFAEQVEQRINKRFGAIEDRLGVTLEDFRVTASGEGAIAAVKSTDPKKRGSVAALLDAGGRDREAEALLAKIDQRLVARGAQRAVDGPITTYALPEDPKAKLDARTAAVFHQDGMVVVSEDVGLAKRLLGRLGGGAGQALADNPAYAQTQSRARRAAGRSPHSVRWYVAPFEWEVAMRPVPQPGDLPDKKSVMAILREQGFDAITGVGGVVSIAATPDRDFIHHTFIYAPPKPGAAGADAKDRYDLAMRMLDLPNGAGSLDRAAQTVETWAPRQVATYKTMYVDIQNAFDHLDTLFDAFAGYKDAFKTTLNGFEKDPFGPKIKIRDEVIANLGNRVVVMTDYTLPIDPECERYLIAIDVINESALRDPLDRWLANDGAERRELQGVTYWEIVPEEEVDADIDALLPVEDDPLAPVGREERVLRRAAVGLHQGRLLIASDADFLRQALFGPDRRQTLSQAPDMRATLAALAEVAPGERAAWTFARNDEAFRPSYELVRAGQMPEAQTFFGRLLNKLLTSEDEREVGAIREQRINGAKLPSFELARRYFGPSARSVRSEPDGWMLSGVVLSKAPLAGGRAASVAQAR